MEEMKINVSDNLTDQRARATSVANNILEKITVNPTGDYYQDAQDWNVKALGVDDFRTVMADLIASALADERRRVLEEAALAIVKRHKSTDSDKWLDLASEMKTYTADGFNPQAHAGQEG